tara:strand:- start:3822 stop:4613 length:792 start_codon:yes stop_codon:yes gene_type:complete
VSSLEKLEVIIPTYHSRALTTILLKSFEKFKPDNLHLIYHVVENSDDISYKQEVLDISENINWYNNPDADTNYSNSNNKPSWANCAAIDYVREKVATPYTLLCHNDCVVTSTKFFIELESKINEGFKLIGTCRFPANNALHVAGLLVETQLLNEVGVTPDFSKGLDVGDILTVHCEENNIPIFCFSNTLNDKSLTKNCNEPWRSLGPNCGIDRALDSNSSDVIYVHLARGAEKTLGRYHKPGKVYMSGWAELCHKHVLEERHV